MPPGLSARERRRQVQRRRALAAIALVAVLGALVAVVMALTGGPDRGEAARAYAAAWSRNDYAAMERLLSGAARKIAPDASALAERYTTAAQTATTTQMRIGEPTKGDDDVWMLPVVAVTRSFGEVRGTIALTVLDEDGEARVDWRPYQVFPGLRPGEQLSRETEMPARSALLARDGTAIAQGPDRTASEKGQAASNIVGSLGDIPEQDRQAAEEAGYPSDAKVGISGLERVFDRQLSGTPGGRLIAGTRTIASRAPVRGPNVRTSISLRVQQAATEALAGRQGGIVVLAPPTGEVLGVAGSGWSWLQPPGSTFKIITASAAIQDGIAKPTSEYPVETAATLSGVELNNSFKEPCGGTLVQAFAKSCNSVFAPLGAKLGGKRLAEMAARFGYDQRAPFPGAAVSTMGDTASQTDDLAVGSAAIGQGKVQSTTLQMAIVAATIGLHGKRPAVTLAYVDDRPAKTTQAVTAHTAAQVERLMEAVVKPGGTGTAAAISGVRVAGKTGTAELRTVDPNCVPDPSVPDKCPTDGDPSNTTAWFAAYAPAGNGKPRVAVAVMLAGAGHGGDTAAPAAKTALVAGLKATR